MLAWVVLAFYLGAESETPPEGFPYQAVVRAERAMVRSGAGLEHFPTQELRRGETVEVYREDPAGWLAIRPPEGSFSWVSADCASVVDDGVAIVEAPRAASLVGSQLTDRRGAFQVMLEQGEALEVLDVVEFREGPRVERWLSIAPPAGEFRWIASADVRRVGEPENEAAPTPPPAADTEEAKPAAFEEAVDEEPTLTAPNQRKWTSAKRPLTPRRLADGEDLSRTIRDELDALEMELTAMVADEPAAWHVEPLQKRLEHLLLLPHTSADAQRSLDISRRLDRFASVQRRASGAPSAPAANLSARPRRPAPLSPRAPAAWGGQAIPQTIAPHAFAPRLPTPGFDAAGILRPVILPGQGGAPAYAIVDRAGRPISYVNPAPGVDLQPYVGRPVGLNGPRAYDLSRRAPLVMAQQVTLLGDVNRR